MSLSVDLCFVVKEFSTCVFEKSRQKPTTKDLWRPNSSKITFFVRKNRFSLFLISFQAKFLNWNNSKKVGARLIRVSVAGFCVVYAIYCSVHYKEVQRCIWVWKTLLFRNVFGCGVLIERVHKEIYAFHSSFHGTD